MYLIQIARPVQVRMIFSHLSYLKCEIQGALHMYASSITAVNLPRTRELVHYKSVWVHNISLDSATNPREVHIAMLIFFCLATRLKAFTSWRFQKMIDALLLLYSHPQRCAGSNTVQMFPICWNYWGCKHDMQASENGNLALFSLLIIFHIKSYLVSCRQASS